METSPKGFRPLSAMYGIGYFPNLGIFWGIHCGILWELSMIVYIFKSQLVIYFFKVSLFVCQNFGFCQDFGSMPGRKEGRTRI